MVVVKNIPTKVVAVFATAAICTVYSCKKYEEGPGFTILTKKMRLTGEWDLEKTISSDGTVDNSSGNMEFEFEKDGDFTVNISYSYGTYSYSYSYKGDWEWEDSKEKIEIQINTQVLEYEILRLTNKEMILEDDYLTEYHFEKQ